MAGFDPDFKESSLQLDPNKPYSSHQVIKRHNQRLDNSVTETEITKAANNLRRKAIKMGLSIYGNGTTTSTKSTAQLILSGSDWTYFIHGFKNPINRISGPICAAFAKQKSQILNLFKQSKDSNFQVKRAALLQKLNQTNPIYKLVFEWIDYNFIHFWASLNPLQNKDQNLEPFQYTGTPDGPLSHIKDITQFINIDQLVTPKTLSKLAAEKGLINPKRQEHYCRLLSNYAVSKNFPKEGHGVIRIKNHLRRGTTFATWWAAATGQTLPHTHYWTCPRNRQLFEAMFPHLIHHFQSFFLTHHTPPNAQQTQQLFHAAYHQIQHPWPTQDPTDPGTIIYTRLLGTGLNTMLPLLATPTTKA